MDVKVGTFNLNNLFTRWNFQAVVPKTAKLEETLEFRDGDDVRFRRFIGRIVTEKKPEDTDTVAGRIKAMDADVLAVQEVENIEALRTFNRDALNGLYTEAALIEGNDPRLIDVAVLSKLPLGRLVSHQTEPDPGSPGKRLFGRDLLQVDVLRSDRSRRLFTLFNTHMKSNFVDTLKHRTVEAQRTEARKANARRKRQAIATRDIIDRETSPTARFVYLGDMNDDPNSTRLAPLVTDTRLSLVDALQSVTETRPAKTEKLGPQPGPRWTSRHKKTGQAPSHRLFDQIWVSPALGDNVKDPTIDRRTKHGGDGSDHDPAWITLTGL